LRPKQKVISSVVDNVVAYTDGTAEIIMNGYHTEIQAILDTQEGESIYNQFVPPRLVYRGTPLVEGKYSIYTYSDLVPSAMYYCQNHIFYQPLPSVKKAGRVFSLANYCVENTIDWRDVTHFLATSQDKAELLAVGTYRDGKILATVAIPNKLTYYCTSGFLSNECNGAVSNWEITRIVFPAGKCEFDRDYSDTEQIKTLRIFEWDIEKRTIEDITPKGFDCNDYIGLSYNHSKEPPYNLKEGDTFYLQLQDGKEIAL